MVAHYGLTRLDCATAQLRGGRQALDLSGMLFVVLMHDLHALWILVVFPQNPAL